MLFSKQITFTYDVSCKTVSLLLSYDIKSNSPLQLSVTRQTLYLSVQFPIIFNVLSGSVYRARLAFSPGIFISPRSYEVSLLSISVYIIAASRMSIVCLLVTFNALLILPVRFVFIAFLTFSVDCEILNYNDLAVK